MSDFGDYDKYDGLGLAELVRKREVKPSQLVEEAISRIERLNPQLNAVIHKMYDLARKAAEGNLPEGSFRGVPFLLKDLNVDYAGVPTRKGSRFHNDFVPDHDSEIVRRFKMAGVIVLGKTNTPEYGLVPVTEPELFGPSNNPWDLTRTTGGSSGGSAAAVAARMVPLAHGNDGGGSIRIPASCCGVFGLKPTRGRNPLGPDLGEAWHGLACDHLLTRSVRDSAAMLDATAGPDVGAPYYAPPPSRPFLDEVGADPGKLRIAFTSKPFLPSTVHDDCVKGLEATVKLCRNLGHEVVEATPQIDGRAFARAFLTMACGETRADIEEAEAFLGRKATSRDFEPATWAVGLLGRQIRAAEFSKAIHLLKRSARQIGPFFEEYDVLLTPTLAMPPVVTGAFRPKGAEAFAMKLLGSLNAGRLINALAGIEALADQMFEFIPFTPLFNATGQPAMSVPLHWNDEGLPIGMHFVSRYGDEATLFRLASQLEKANSWFDRLPPICS
ncbi:MAG TPA: amidase [Sedimentisphaerales bacterium]|nr:amidase [Sedimentisphaerales bacterium]